MNYHGMEPNKHLEFMFNAKIEQTGQYRYVQEDLFVYQRLSYNDIMPFDRPVRKEAEIAIKMGERDYDNFMASYGKYLELAYTLEQDPVAKDMFEKLMTYIILKR